MEKKTRDRTIYYIIFPLMVIALCAYSYYLGYSQGKFAKSTTLNEGEKPSKDSDIKGLEPKKLTFFKELRPVHKELEDKVEKWVQVSAFQKIGKADEMLDRLKNDGFRGKIESDSGDSGFHRVFVGPYTSVRDAEESLLKLEKKGFGKGFVVNK